jgi:hypothetical protein
MMSHDGICRLVCPEIKDDQAIQDRVWWMLPFDLMRWGALHILDDYKGNIRLIAFMVALLI